MTATAAAVLEKKEKTEKEPLKHSVVAYLCCISFICDTKTWRAVAKSIKFAAHLFYVQIISVYRCVACFSILHIFFSLLGRRRHHRSLSGIIPFPLW